MFSNNSLWLRGIILSPSGTVILSLLTVCHCDFFLLHSSLTLSPSLSNPKEFWPDSRLLLSPDHWKKYVTGRRNPGMIIEIWSMMFLCDRSHWVCSLTSFSVSWGDAGSTSASWTTVSQTCVCGPFAVSLNWTGSSRPAPSAWAKMDPSVRTLKMGSLLWKATSSFPMQSSNFTAERRIENTVMY